MLHNTNTFNIFIFIGCPIGYYKKDGDVKGHGLGELKGTTIDQCKTDCDNRDDCRSFTHSSTLQHCYLLEETAPTSSKYEDFIFCAKEGNASTFGPTQIFFKLIIILMSLDS